MQKYLDFKSLMREKRRRSKDNRIGYAKNLAKRYGLTLTKFDEGTLLRISGRGISIDYHPTNEKIRIEKCEVSWIRMTLEEHILFQIEKALTRRESG